MAPNGFLDDARQPSPPSSRSASAIASGVSRAQRSSHSPTQRA